MDSVQPYKVLLLDIEGTTTSIAFVKDTLFPYAAKNVERFLETAVDVKETDETYRTIVDELIKLSLEQSADDRAGVSVVSAADGKLDIVRKLANNVRTWIEQDKKLTALKKLQGQMWKDAYLNGEIRGHVYADVPEALRRLYANGIRIYIFSSGSVQAQRLLFQHSDYGDLTELLSGYFDTNVGSKVEVTSYESIAEQIGQQPSKILFVTDVDKEAIAARKAGLQTLISVRDGNAPLDEAVKASFRQIHSFDEIPTIPE